MIPLPEPARESESACAAWRNAHPDYYTADQMLAYAAAVRAEALEEAAHKVEITNCAGAGMFRRDLAAAVRALRASQPVAVQPKETPCK